LKRLLIVLMVIMLPLLAQTGAVHAASGTPPSVAPPHIFRAFNHAGAPTGGVSGGTVTPGTPCGSACDGQNLQYGGGFVMHTTRSYVIFWLPTGDHFEGTSTTGSSTTDTRYENLIDQYFNDIGGSSFYNLLTQYSTSNGATVTNGPILNSSTLGGSWVDTRPYQHSDGSTKDSSGHLVGSSANPLYDYYYNSTNNGDLYAEALHAMSTNGWTAGRNTEFFVYTAYGVLSCSDNQKGSCSLGEPSADSSAGDYCAYHTAGGSTSTPVIYANMPDGYSLGQLASASGYSCGDLHPNSDYYADNEISTTSHEQFESITDPWPTNGWFDQNDFSGGEIGDKCAYVYPSGNTPSTPDITMNGHGYGVQMEWSNASTDCEVALTGSSSKLAVQAVDAVTGNPITNATAGNPISVTALAEDSSGNPVSFNGTLHITSTDPQATLPADSAVVFDGSGAASSSSVTLGTAGNQSVTVSATDGGGNTISGTVNLAVSAAPATQLVLSGGNQGYAFTNQPFSLSLTAEDQYGNTDTSYAGTVRFSSSDANASLPGNYTFSPASDSGTHTFNSGATMQSAGSQSITAVDTGNSSIAGHLDLTVSTMLPPSAPTGLSASRANHTIGLTWNAPSSLGGDSASHVTYQVTVTHEDGTGAPEATLGSTSCASGITSCSATISSLANTTGYSVSVTASNSAGAGGVAAQNLDPTPATQFVVTAPSTAQALAPAAVTVTAEDQYGEVTPYYTGTVHLSSTDGNAVLPADYGFTSGDAGARTFNVTFKTTGTQKVTATDTQSASVAGTSGNVNVTGAPAAPGVAIAAPGDGSITLAWTASKTTGVTGYSVAWSGSDGTSGSQNVTGTTTTFSGLTNGVSYTYSVASNNALGSGPNTIVTASPTALRAQYTDALSAQVAMGTADGKVGTLSETGTLPLGLHFLNNRNNTGTLSGTITGAPKAYTVTFHAAESIFTAAAAATVTVTPEDAFLTYSGDTMAPSNGHVNLRATLWDSGAAGYPGANADGTTGVVTYAIVYFTIYPTADCSGSPLTSVRALMHTSKVAGVGTATATYTLPSGTTALCAVANTPPSATTAVYYQAPAAAPQPITVYTPATHSSVAATGTTVLDGAGSGALTDSVSSKTTYLPTGKFVYSYSTTYKGQAATATITSTSITAFTATGGIATIQGKATIKVTPVGSTTYLLYDSLATYQAVLVDGGPNGVGDTASLLFYDGNGLVFHQVTAAGLGAGDITNS
jgi:hypothetical protein